MDDLTARLRKHYSRAKLPMGICFETNNTALQIKMCAERIGLEELSGIKIKPCNMQTDAAAFEGWALVMKALLLFDSVVLDATAELPDPKPKGNLHYNRFLFRAMKFSQYYSWFVLSDKISEKVKRFAAIFGSGNSILHNNSGIKEATTSGKMDSIYTATENQLEGWLAEVTENTPNQLNRQLPVGIFRKDVCQKEKRIVPNSVSAVFTHRGSAVDLWKVQNDIMYIYELKNGNNRSVGNQAYIT